MRKTAYALGLVAALVATGPAGATGCPQITDPLADTQNGSGPYSTNTDIVSADVAGGATTVVAVVRVATLLPDPASATGAQWGVGWQVDGVTHFATVRRDAAGTYTTGKLRGGPPGAPYSFTVDALGGTITMTVPRTSFTALGSPGETFTDLFAIASVLIPTANGSTSITKDAATAPGVTYVDGSPGCVPAA